MTNNRSLVRTFAAIFCMVSLLAAVTYYWWFQNWGPGYYAELNTLRADLEKIPNIEIVQLEGVDDEDIPFLRNLKHLRAEIEISGKGRMAFTALSADSAVDTQHLVLESVGPYQMRIRGEGFEGVYREATREPVRSEFATQVVDIGPDGPLSHLFPFEIRNIQTAINHYDEIYAVLESLTQKPNEPKFYQTDKGTEYFYWGTPVDLSAMEDPMWAMPLAELRMKSKQD